MTISILERAALDEFNRWPKEIQQIVVDAYSATRITGPVISKTKPAGIGGPRSSWTETDQAIFCELVNKHGWPQAKRRIMRQTKRTERAVDGAWHRLFRVQFPEFSSTRSKHG